MRSLLAAAALPFLATFAPLSLHVPDPIPPKPRIVFTPIAVGAERVGPLRVLGGWTLRSDHRGVGGLSAMQIDGRKLLAISDAGYVIHASLPRSLNAFAAAAAVTPLRHAPGPLTLKQNRDVEAMQVRGDSAWLAFETSNAVWRYSTGDWLPRAKRRPAAMAGWRLNRGAEAMLRLGDGRFLIFREEPDEAGTSDALLFHGDPAEARTRVTRLLYRAPEGYRLTDAALLPDGRPLFLNRRFQWGRFTAKLAVGTLPPLKADAVLEGREIAEFAPPLAADNFEALSVTREAGRTIVWIASDDNFSPRQRTLLLKFALEP